MAATQALREILAEGIAAADISEIRAAVLPPHLKMIDHGVMAGDRASHLTSLPYQMAVAAVAPDAALDVAQSPQAVAEPLRALMQRITVVGDDALLADYPAAWPARISVATSGGTREHAVTHVPGDPVRPLDRQQLTSKFLSLVTPAIGRERAEDMFSRIVDEGDPGGLTSLIHEVVRLT